MLQLDAQSIVFEKNSFFKIKKNANRIFQNEGKRQIVFFENEYERKTVFKQSLSIAFLIFDMIPCSMEMI